MSSPKVTVMLPSYNHEKYIAEAIESCLNQTFQDFEIIMSDDCSTDNTVAVARQFNDERLTIHRFEHNVGAVANHYYCYSRAIAGGGYIALLNSDDVWLPTHLEEKAKYLDGHPECGAVFSFAMAIDEDGRVIEPSMQIFQQPNRSREEWILHFFTKGNCLCHPSMLIRKEVYEKVGFYRSSLRQLPDFEMWIRVVKEYDIHIIQKVQVKHRRCVRTMTNTSTDTTANNIRIENESLLIVRHFFDEMDDELFKRTFGELFRNPEASTHEELTCEKFFLLLDGKAYSPQVTPLVAQEFFYNNLDSSSFLQLLKDKYRYTLDDYYKFCGKRYVYSLGAIAMTFVKRESPVYRFMKNLYKRKKLAK